MFGQRVLGLSFSLFYIINILYVFILSVYLYLLREWAACPKREDTLGIPRMDKMGVVCKYLRSYCPFYLYTILSLIN